MTLSKISSVKGELIALGIALVSSSFWGAPAIAFPMTGPTVLAQEDPQFEFEDFDFWADQCLLLSQGEDPEKALESCEQAISLRPGDDNINLWTARGTILFALEQYPEAIASFNRVIRVAPQDSISLAYQCAAHVQLNQYSDAIDTCEEALQINGNWGDRSPGFAWYQRGLALLEIGRLETALDSFTRAVRNQSENVVYEANKCALEIELSAFDSRTGCNLPDTISLYEQALAIEPDNLNLLIQQGLALEQINEHERALLSYEQALTIRPDYALALARQCSALNQVGDYEAALAACEAALQGDNRWGRVGVIYGWTQHSRALIGLGDYENALASAQRAVDLLPTDLSPTAPNEITDEQPPLTYPPAWNNLAVVYWHLEEYTQAEAAIETTLEHYAFAEQTLNETFERSYPESPILFYQGYVLAHYNQGRILAAMNRPNLAVEAYDNALKRYVRSPVQSLLGSDISLIEPELESAIYTHKAIAHLQLGELRDSQLSAIDAVRIDPESFTAQYNQGLIYLENGNYGSALASYEIANQMQPENIYVLTGQGLALAGLGRPQAALTVLEQVLNMSPGYAPADTARTCILDKLGTAAIAANTHREQLAQAPENTTDIPDLEGVSETVVSPEIRQCAQQ